MANVSRFVEADYEFMARAIKLAQQGQYTTSPNPRVGCVIVKNGQIIAEGFHIKAGSGHAEVNAIANANESLAGATAYVTLEPCSHYGKTPPCAQALINSGITQVICAMIDPNPEVAGRGVKMLQQAGVEVSTGLLARAASELNTGFIKLMTTGLPYVRCKMAASLDGKTAMANGESQWITGKAARQDVQRIRARSCAVITSAQSVISDNARMTVREAQFNLAEEQYPLDTIRQPVRVVIDSQARLTPGLALFQTPSPVIIINRNIENSYDWPHFVSHWTIESNDSEHIDLRLLLIKLAKQGYNDILLEAGKSLAGAFVEQGLVDELILYMAPKLLGNDAQGLLSMPSITELATAKRLMITDTRVIGSDLKVIAKFTEHE
ncbi:bifunctional diaminohydroxyphosphoribosylaminopyrimidine deaminase/5-amino-6-(5-phosphoribosylamino)uracil reductase RibD [Thalassotalea ganghwensis]